MRYSLRIERNTSVNYKTNHKGNTFFRNRLYFAYYKHLIYNTISATDQ